MSHLSSVSNQQQAKFHNQTETNNYISTILHSERSKLLCFEHSMCNMNKVSLIGVFLPSLTIISLGKREKLVVLLIVFKLVCVLCFSLPLVPFLDLDLWTCLLLFVFG